MKTLRHSLTLFFAGISIVSFSQRDNLKFEHLGREQGLSHSNVICVLQDSRGFMWFGTRDGLNKYDGYTFTVYKNSPGDFTSLSNNTIQDLVEDSIGRIWIATAGGGLDQFDRDHETFNHHRHNPRDPATISEDHLNSLFVDRNGSLWIGTEGSGLDRYDEQTKTFTHFVHDKNDPGSLSQNLVKDIMEDSRGNLWVASSEKGLNLLDRKKGTFTCFTHDPHNSKTISSNSVITMFEDSHQQLWIGTRGGGLNRFDYSSRQFERFQKKPGENSLPHNVVLSLNEDDQGHLWIGTENGGLSIFNPRTRSFLNYLQDDIDRCSLSNNSIWTIYKDRKADMWIGTFSGDINFWSSDNNKFAHYRHSSNSQSLSHNKVLTIYEDSKNNLWIGTDGGGLDLFDRKTKTFTHHKHEENNPNTIAGNFVLDVLEDSRGNLWIGTWGDGITVYNPSKKTYRHFKNDPKNPKSLSSNNAWTIYEDGHQNVWIGTFFGGLNRFNRADESFTRFVHDEADAHSLGSNNVNLISGDSQGNLWVGTDGGGLNLFDEKTREFKQFQHIPGKNSISDNTVTTIFEGPDGGLWIGTRSGLNYFDAKTTTFTIYRTTEGLASNSIFGIVGDRKGSLWISTGKGLSRFNIANKRFRNFDMADGLQSNEFKEKAYCRSYSGHMYFGGNNGLNEFFPDSIRDKAFDPPLVLTSFQLFNEPVRVADKNNPLSPLVKSISETKEITLSYDQSVVSFEFASLNYTPPTKKQYEYFMEGFDKSWNSIGSKHSATYTNLDPGEYTLWVRSLDNVGRLSTEQIALKLHIEPPFWLTWWFKLLAVFMVAGGLFTFFKIRMTIMKRQKWELEQKVRERTNRLVHLTNEESKARKEAEAAYHEAEQANKAKSIFLATMSHEIRTPMNGVIGMASLLSETTLTEEQQEYTETIRSCSESLLTVINDILDFSKIESGKMELESKNFNLRSTIEEVLDLFAARTSQLGLDLIYMLDHSVPAHLIGDSLRLRQVLINLIGNAVKFTKAGEIFVGVHLLEKTDDTCRLTFEVRDTGIGIPQDKIGRLFKAFSQVDSSTTRKYGGTGLGLAISEKIVDLMGGTISVSSTEGRGTTFTFSIETGISTEAIPTYVTCNTDGLEGKKILVVDDNITNLNILKAQLEQWKFDITLAHSGKEALRIAIEDEDFDMILTDMQMPEMNGAELAHALRVARPALPIILLSSIGDERGKKYDGLFSSILTKPVKQNMLCRHILNEFRKHGNTSAVEQKEKVKLPANFSKRIPLRILIAEDNPVNQKLTQKVLGKLGYQSDIANNGREALEAIQLNSYDLILMDVQMPEMDGLEATRQIRLLANRQPTIVAMTANAMQGDREECLLAGMDDYISKPVNLDELVRTLEKWSRKTKEEKQLLATLSPTNEAI